MSRVTLTVKWWNDRKGIGFALQPGGQDVFLHYKNFVGVEGRKTLHEGQQIECGVENTDRGPRGIEIKPS